MIHVNFAAILPSRNERATIADVTTAVDTAIGAADAAILHADSSDTPDTAARFMATPTRAAKVPLTGLARGKGGQILAAARHDAITGADAVLVADTDTRNPDPDTYRTLLARIETGASLAVADYPRHWDEANLTNHLARPLIAATTGHDIPQPLAGDIAISRQCLDAALRAAETLPADVAMCVNGYGIDAFLLLTAASVGPIASVRVEYAKQHAGSFLHLPTIYHEAVPALLHLTGRRSPPHAGNESGYRIADRRLEPAQLRSMLTTLDGLASRPDRYDSRPWSFVVAEAWQAVHQGCPPVRAARLLWPHYVHRVRDWLTRGQLATATSRARMLSDNHTHLHTAVLALKEPLP